jgi:hypothetical protein
MDSVTNKVESGKVGRFEIGKAYVYKDEYGGDKYFLQRESDVLMVNTSIDLINIHEVDKLVINEKRDGYKFEDVPLDEFKNIIRQTIFNLGIYEFVKND